jgi:hypothetical protein
VKRIKSRTLIILEQVSGKIFHCLHCNSLTESFFDGNSDHSIPGRQQPKWGQTIITVNKFITKVNDVGMDLLEVPRYASSSTPLFLNHKSDTLVVAIEQLNLICAPTNALLSVIEPEKCEYLFTVSSPAVCYLPPVVTKGDGILKEEL